MKRSVARRSTHRSFASVQSTWHSLDVQVAAGREEKERVLDAAYDEYCRLRDNGAAIHASVFCDRYPTYRKSLRRLIDVHEALGDSGWDEDSWPKPDSLFLGFVVHRELGVGAIARVYLASELALGRRLVALKVSHYGGDEAETLGKLIHPNVVPVHSVHSDSESGMTAVCMPYLGSSTLADVLEVVFGGLQPPKRARQIVDAARERELLSSFQEDQPQDAPDRILLRGSYVDGVVHLGTQLAQALAYTHERGVLHRDLKPSNVLITPSGLPMLLDFNLSCDAEMNINRMGGTLPYMAPEQIRVVFDQPSGAENHADPRSDIFSLGVILYEMLTGKLPFGEPPPEAAPRAAAQAYLGAQQRRPAPITQLNRHVDADTAAVVERCLDADPELRPASAEQLGGLLEQHFAPARRAKRALYRHRRLASAVAALIVVLAAIVSWHFATRPPAHVREHLRGLADYERGRWPEAIEHFDAALRLDSQFEKALFGRGIAYLEAGDYSSAILSLKDAAETLDDATAWECLAYAYFKDRQLSVAAVFYEKASARIPRARLFLNSGYCKFKGGRPGPAHVDLGRAIELEPELGPAYQLRAAATRQMLESGRTELVDQMLRDIESALRFSQEHPWLYFEAALDYAVAAESRPELVPQLRKYVRAAVDAGWPRSAFDKHLAFTRLEGEKWYTDLLARCRLTESEPEPVQFVSPAPANQFLRLLK